MRSEIGDREAGRAGADSASWGPEQRRTVRWHRPQPTPELLAMSGLDYLRAVIAGELPPPPIAGVASLEIVSVEPGVVHMRSTPGESWLNPNGDVHGGWMCTLLDSSMGIAVTTTVDAMATAYSSIELKVSFLKAVRLDGGPIEVRGSVLRVGRRVAFAEAHARDADGTLVGHATSSLARVR